MILILLFSFQSWALTNYNCTSEFGERVVLGLNSQTWNSHATSIVRQRSSVKVSQIESGKKKYRLSTRYLRQKGNDFRMSINCSSNTGKCEGNFLAAKKKGSGFENKDSIFVAPMNDLFDRRSPFNRGFVELRWTNRGSLGLLARIHRWRGESPTTSVQRFSSSGESKIFIEPRKFSMDVGVDEYLMDGEVFVERIASLELKMECEAQ